MCIFPTFQFRVERWNFNKDYGVYVSALGNFKDRHKRNLPIKINRRTGYCAIKTEQGNVFAHRLVMFTWRPIPNAETLTVDHLNHNKRDNSVANLEWVTKEENTRRAEADLINVPMVAKTEDYIPVFKVNNETYVGIDAAMRAIKDIRPGIHMHTMIAAIAGLLDGSNTSGKKNIGKGERKVIVELVKK